MILRRRLPDGTYSRGRPWWRQSEICDSVVKYRDTAVYTGNMLGKDWILGTLVPWWLWTKRDAMVIVTGPSQRQLGSITWKEIKQAIKGARFPLRCKISQGIQTSPLTITRPNGKIALGYSTTSVERAAGHHGPNILVIVEEASGVEDETWDAVNSWGYRRLLAIGNPTRCDGRFIALIRQADADLRDGIPPELAVNAIQIASTESPHAKLDKSPWGMADATWLETQYRRYGRDSLWVRSHIDAIIPEVSSEALIPEPWLDACLLARRPPEPRNPREAIDLGEGVGRDCSVVLIRDDFGILEIWISNTHSLGSAADMAAKLAAKWKVPHHRISYDALGIGGEFPHHLYRHGIRGAIGYGGEGSPRDPGRFTNIRSEAAWSVRNRLNPDHAPDWRHDPHARQPLFNIPNRDWWPRLREELKALDYSQAGNKIQLILKKDHTARLGHSPDIADALIQSFM